MPLLQDTVTVVAGAAVVFTMHCEMSQPVHMKANFPGSAVSALVTSIPGQVAETTFPLGPTIFDLGWTREEAQSARLAMRSFEEEWDAPGMEAYDAL